MEQLKNEIQSDLVELDTHEEQTTQMKDAGKEKSGYKSKLQKQWASNLAALTPRERDDLTAQEDECKMLCLMIDDVLAGIRYGFGKGVAGAEGRHGMCFPDATFIQVEQFIQQYPLVHWWLPRSNANLVPSISDFDDDNFKRFGKRTRIWITPYREFLLNVLIWLSRSTDEDSPEMTALVTAALKKVNPNQGTSEQTARPARIYPDRAYMPYGTELETVASEEIKYIKSDHRPLTSEERHRVEDIKPTIVERIKQAKELVRSRNGF